MKLLNNNKGVTVLEGVIAMGLLALITAGAFGVLLSASRQSSVPDTREEMTYAVEKANDLLKAYIGGTNHLPSTLTNGLCGGSVVDPLYEHDYPHQISCMLPPVCDQTNGNSSFTYKVTSHGLQDDSRAPESKETGNVPMQMKRINFSITCNGYEL